MKMWNQFKAAPIHKYGGLEFLGSPFDFFDFSSCGEKKEERSRKLPNAEPEMRFSNSIRDITTPPPIQSLSIVLLSPFIDSPTMT